MNGPLELTIAESTADFADARALFIEYASSLGVDLTFQGFAGELTTLHRMYAAPEGCLLLARAGKVGVGCIAVRALSERDCEMKRLYVCNSERGSGLGRSLALRAIDWARHAGYKRMCLDTLEQMDAAQRLYTRLGFVTIGPYYHTPLPGTRFMALTL